MIQSYDRASLAVLLEYELDRRIDDIVPPDVSFPAAVLNLLHTASQEGWLPDLIKAVHKRFLQGVSFPASKEKVASYAEVNGAPQEVVSQIRNADTERFNSSDEALQAVLLGYWAGGSTFRLIPTSIEQFRKLKTRVYVASVGDREIANLYADPETRTLVWEGHLAFQELGHVVFEELPKRVSREDPPSRANLYVGMALFFREGDVVEGVLGRDMSDEEHEKMLSSGTLVAASYDVASGEEEPPENALDYALTAEDIRLRSLYLEEMGFSSSACSYPRTGPGRRGFLSG